MADTEYEMIPHKLLADLRYDVEALQKKLSQPDAKINELILEIESMKDSVHELTTVFQKALEDIKEEGDIAKTVHTMKEKMDTVVTQNETIAKGMIAISDKVEEWMNSQDSNVGAPAPPLHQLNENHSMAVPPPMSGGPARVAPKPAAPLMSSGDFPPPPPKASDQKKRFGLFK